MTWEYFVAEFNMNELRNFQDQLNTLGVGAWELVALLPQPGKGATTHRGVFKRPGKPN